MNADIITLSPESLNLIWLILFVVLLVIELLTVGLTTIWFAAGSLAPVHWPHFWPTVSVPVCRCRSSSFWQYPASC